MSRPEVMACYFKASKENTIIIPSGDDYVSLVSPHSCFIQVRTRHVDDTLKPHGPLAVDSFCVPHRGLVPNMEAVVENIMPNILSSSGVRVPPYYHSSIIRKVLDCARESTCNIHVGHGGGGTVLPILLEIALVTLEAVSSSLQLQIEAAVNLAVEESESESKSKSKSMGEVDDMFKTTSSI